MRINHNISAINTNRLLASNNSSTAKNLEKLSSGLAVNRAGDNAAGLAISEKMRGQIRGLDQATNNANDGISLIQTAEGGLNETHAILQRMRELAVQSANDTNTDSDRKEIQKEVDQLNKEITRISTDTEFNTKKLLNGDMAATATTTGTNAANVTAKVAAGSNLTASGTYTITMDFTGKDAVGDKAAEVKASATASGDLTPTFADDAAKTKLATAAGLSQVEYSEDATQETATLTLTQNGDGAANSFTLKKGDTVIGEGNAAKMLSDFGITVTAADEKEGKSATIEVKGGVKASPATDASFKVTNIVDADGNKVSNSAFELELTAAGAALTADNANFQLEVNVNTDNALTFHIGANSGQNTKLTVQDMSAKSLGVENVDLTSQKSSDAAITTIDNAINTVSAQRAALGAMQNRLEHTINNLGTSSENLSAAESQIRDVDMAEEMSNYTKNNILVQAATSMLAQANQQPQSVLSLLG